MTLIKIAQDLLALSSMSTSFTPMDAAGLLKKAMNNDEEGFKTAVEKMMQKDLPQDVRKIMTAYSGSDIVEDKAAMNHRILRQMHGTTGMEYPVEVEAPKEEVLDFSDEDENLMDFGGDDEEVAAPEMTLREKVAQSVFDSMNRCAVGTGQAAAFTPVRTLANKAITEKDMAPLTELLARHATALSMVLPHMDNDEKLLEELNALECDEAEQRLVDAVKQSITGVRLALASSYTPAAALAGAFALIMMAL
jgi:hypothetical protein